MLIGTWTGVSGLGGLTRGAVVLGVGSAVCVEGPRVAGVLTVGVGGCDMRVTRSATVLVALSRSWDTSASSSEPGSGGFSGTPKLSSWF